LSEIPASEDAQAPRVPLLITAELPADVLAWADALRRAHYPPERNRLRAHVTLFHALPPSAEGEIRRLLAELASAPAPEARTNGVMDFGKGTAIAIECRAMVMLHGEIAQRLHGLLTAQDAQPLRLHVTVQNKVTPQEAKALQAELAQTLVARSFRFKGFGLYGWHDGLWNPKREFPFRGMQKPASQSGG
jgi:2'-5' RNA ligase